MGPTRITLQLNDLRFEKPEYDYSILMVPGIDIKLYNQAGACILQYTGMRLTEFTSRFNQPSRGTFVGANDAVIPSSLNGLQRAVEKLFK